MRPRPLRTCARDGCPDLTRDTYCPCHAPPPWHGGTRREIIGKSGSAQQRDNARTMRAHHGICHVCGQPGADRVDHVLPVGEGGADEPWNRAPIHAEPCHRQKTAAEAARGRERRRQR